MRLFGLLAASVYVSVCGVCWLGIGVPVQLNIGTFHYLTAKPFDSIEFFLNKIGF